MRESLKVSSLVFLLLSCTASSVVGQYRISDYERAFTPNWQAVERRVNDLNHRREVESHLPHKQENIGENPTGDTKTLAPKVFGRISEAQDTPAPLTTIKLPDRVRVPKDQLPRLEAEAPGEIKWYFDEALGKSGEYELVGKKIIFPPRAGTWVIVAFGVIDGKPVVSNRCTMTIDGAAPVPPGPVPPTPDTFKDRLYVVYKADNGDQAKKGLLVELLRRAAGSTEHHAKVQDFYLYVERSMEKVVGGALVKTRPVIQDELLKRFPPPDSTYELAEQIVAGQALRDVAKVLDDLAPPVPPDPPKPPTPPPSPAPIPVDGFRVLVVYESGDLSKLPKEQLAILTDRSVRDYLNVKCVKDARGMPEYRFYDQNVIADKDAELWRNTLKRARNVLPWIVVSDHPRGGYEGPLPKSVNETLELLRKYGG